MTVNQTSEQDWADLSSTWREQDAHLELSEHELRARLRRDRLIEALVHAAEWLSLAVALGVAVWMFHDWPTRRPGLILIEWLLLQAAVVLWMRRRRRSQRDLAVLDRIDASIEGDNRLLESVRLGGVMGLIALAAMIIAVAFSLQRHPVVVSVGTLTSLSILFVYVFAMQTALVVYGRRVRRRRMRLERMKRALRNPE
jgi:hypothetical protein